MLAINVFFLVSVNVVLEVPLVPEISSSTNNHLGSSQVGSGVCSLHFT